LSSDREAVRAAFLKAAGLDAARRQPIPGDASTRRYERLVTPAGARLILMDAPPSNESPPCDPSWDVAERTRLGWNAMARLAASRVEAFAAAAGLQQHVAFVGNDDVRLASTLQMGLQPVGEGVDVDHRPGDALLQKAVQHVIDQHAAANLHQRLGPVVGQRSHPRAETGGQHHGRDGRAHDRVSVGACRSNQRLSPSMPGCARLRSSCRHMRGRNWR
jgi:hypothetical protein